MKEKYFIRDATLKDINFLVKTIIEADKSGTDKLSFATLFNLSEAEVKKYITNILEEEINGCEFSISSFLVIEFKGDPVAAVGGWLEGGSEVNLSSAILKSNLIGYYFPKESILYANSKSEIIKNTQISRENNTYQIEYVYVDERHRGHNLAGLLIDAHVQRSKKEKCKIVQIQLSANNAIALKCYQRCGFDIVQSFGSEDVDVLNYLPSNYKLLIQKVVE